MHQACLGSFQRVFVDDAGQLETCRSLTGNVGHRRYAAFKANAHRTDIFRYVDHYLRGGLYLDIKTALLEPLERIQERIVAEFKADKSLIAHAANLYGWDPDALAASHPPDYFMTAFGTRKDHIFQGILLGRPRHPLMLAALLHCFGPTLVDQQDLSGFRYMAFCEELFRVIKADRYQGAGTPLTAGWVLGFGLGPIYLLQETHEPALKPKGLRNDGHCFRTAGGQLVALTRCWKWNKGWRASKPSTTAAASQGTASGSGGGTAASSQAPPQPAQPPDLAAVQAHIMAALETDLLDKIIILVEQWPHQYYGSLTRALVEELAPKGLCLNPAGEYLACAFCRGRAGNPVEFATDAGLKNHYLRQSGASENWPPLRPLTTRAQQARTGARGTGTAGTPDPKDESGTQAPPPRETSVHGVLQAAEFGAVWRSRKVVISEEGRLTIATTTKFRNQVGQVVREEEQVLPRATLWVGGLRAFLQHAIRLSFFKREVSEANFKRFALAFQTIYDTAAKRAHNSTRCVIHYATGNSEEEGATLKLTHGETAFQKFRAVTGLEPSRVLAPAGRGPADRGYPRQNQREAEDDNRWYWHEDRRAAPKRPWQPWQSDRWNP
eukprot:s5887_g4.t1